MSLRIFVEGNDDKNFIIKLLNDLKRNREILDIEKLKLNKKPIANLYRDLYPYPQFDFKDKRFQLLKEKLKNLFKERI